MAHILLCRRGWGPSCPRNPSFLAHILPDIQLAILPPQTPHSPSPSATGPVPMSFKEGEPGGPPYDAFTVKPHRLSCLFLFCAPSRPSTTLRPTCQERETLLQGICTAVMCILNICRRLSGGPTTRHIRSICNLIPPWLSAEGGKWSPRALRHAPESTVNVILPLPCFRSLKCNAAQ